MKFLARITYLIVVQWRHYKTYEGQRRDRKWKILKIGLLSTVMPLYITIKHARCSSILIDQKKQLRDAQTSQDQRIDIYKILLTSAVNAGERAKQEASQQLVKANSAGFRNIHNRCD